MNNGDGATIVFASLEGPVPLQSPARRNTPPVEAWSCLTAREVSDDEFAIVEALRRARQTQAEGVPFLDAQELVRRLRVKLALASRDTCGPSSRARPHRGACKKRVCAVSAARPRRTRFWLTLALRA